eukprot:TRINITY_DN29741_c0_g1_i1.p1 TRINITY_DN29741_c0_g1~~TRINITY_DN29741_c0_g1_i1.p1  ORF type:complete len:321 (+),score=87.46 TRINITY_DN29741_c0_g1_i1:46-1008(+)
MSLPKPTLWGGSKILQAAVPCGETTLDLIGRSWAMDSTAFVAPELKCGFDAGYVVYGKKLPWYFVTHVHSDHGHYMTHIKSRQKPPTVCVPAESQEHVVDFLDAAQKMTSHMSREEYSDFEWTEAYRLRGVKHGDRIEVDKKEGLYCDVVQCDHRVPTVGYRMVRVKQKLKAEYASLPGNEIGALRKAGVEVTAPEETPLVAFMGDTTVVGVFGIHGEEHTDMVAETRRVVLSTPVVIIECTFLTDDQREQAEKTKHVLWSDLKPHVCAHPDTLFVLIHFSHRYTPHDVRTFFAAEAVPNVLPWVGPEDADTLEEVWGHS